MRQNIKEFIKEIISVVAGILIALWINNWNENRKDRNYIEKISLSINKELAETNEDIVDKIALQGILLDTINFYLKDNQISILNITIKSQGIYIPAIKINSLKALSNSKIELMEYDKISALANLEEQKDILKMKTERLADFIYSNTTETKQEKKEFMKMLLLDIINTEKALQTNIDGITTN